MEEYSYDDSNYYDYPYYYNDYYNDSYLYNMSSEELRRHLLESTKFDFYWLPVFDFEVIVLGFVRPVLVMLTTLANLFVVGYFLSSRNRGKATSVLFVSIAVSDTLTGIILLPNSIYVYALMHEDLSYAWCYVYMHTRLYFSRAFHTISIWQTVLLGVQRYMCVCHPFLTGKWCSVWKTFLAIIIVYILAFTLHSPHLLDEKTDFNECKWLTESPCTSSCVYIWFCIVLMHFTPCAALIWLTSKTLSGLRKAGRRVSSMIPGTSGQRSSRDRIITLTATLVVIVFLIPEIPFSFYNLAFVIKKHMGTGLGTKANHVFLSVYEILLIVSFNCNFWIYCVMMQDFRKLIHRVLRCGVVKRGLQRMRSLSSRGGSTMTSVSRTSSVASRHRVLSTRTTVYSQSELAHTLVQISPTTQNPPGSPISPVSCTYADGPSAAHTDDLEYEVFV